MRVNCKKFLVLFILLASIATAHGQESIAVNYMDTPLKNVLLDLEKKTGLLFSFSDEIIAGKTITKTDESINLEEASKMTIKEDTFSTL